MTELRALPPADIETGIFPALQPPESLTTEQLVEIAAGTFQRVQDSMSYIVELRKRFKAAPRGKAHIAGCDTWEQFCEKHLHRTASAIRKALQTEDSPKTMKTNSEGEVYRPEKRKNRSEPIESFEALLALCKKVIKTGYEQLKQEGEDPSHLWSAKTILESSLKKSYPSEDAAPPREPDVFDELEARLETV